MAFSFAGGIQKPATETKKAAGFCCLRLLFKNKI